MPLKRVLVGDDHEITRRGIREVLRDEFGDLDIHDAADFPTVLAQVEAHPFDLVLLDIGMPGGTVVDVIRGILAIQPAVPILVFTAILELEHVFETLKAGAKGVLHKQRASDELVVAVQRVIHGTNYLHPETAIAVATALRETPEPPPHHSLSAREREIFCLIAQGRAVKEIAGDLGLSDKTVATYLARIRDKTGLTSHVEIARYALQHGLVK